MENLTRRSLFQIAASAALPLGAADAAPELEYLTPVERAGLLDKGKADVAKLPPERLREIGLMPEVWSLDMVPEPGDTAVVERPFSRALGNAFRWGDLMKLAEKHVVRFLHPCVCTNGNDPYHVTLWEGVPLREVIWLAQPKANIRRVYYQSYHPENLAPFQASLSLNRILETPPGEVPPVLAYKMNGQIMTAAHGGPVRVVVPGTYGSKSIKWVQRLVFTNESKANDTDAEPQFNNDIESPLKTRARFINAPKELPARKPATLTGFAQVGISGLAKVQYSVHSQKEPRPEEWKDAAILPPPENWGGGLPGGKLPEGTFGFDAKTGKPVEWPMKYTNVLWAALLPGLEPGSYDLGCRTIDGNGIAQPMPRPFLRTGVTAIHRVTLIVKE
jgi:DMSO/TMAO reductase YedYZ molybdopterin-dependent catalytic subunit